MSCKNVVKKCKYGVIYKKTKFAMDGAVYISGVHADYRHTIIFPVFITMFKQEHEISAQIDFQKGLMFTKTEFVLYIEDYLKKHIDRSRYRLIDKDVLKTMWDVLIQEGVIVEKEEPF